MILRGRAWRFGDNIDTDVIIPYKYKARTLDPEELGKHAMEGIDPDFSRKISKGDFVVAGKNFGCGSSREQAPVALKGAGVGAVIAKSFARIFYRNAINIGLPVLELDEVDRIDQGDELEVDLERGIVRNLTKGEEYKAKKPPSFLFRILEEGGVVSYIRKHGKPPWRG